MGRTRDLAVAIVFLLCATVVTSAQGLAANTGTFIYQNEKFDVRRSTTNAGPALVEQFTESYRIPSFFSASSAQDLVVSYGARVAASFGTLSTAIQATYAGSYLTTLAATGAGASWADALTIEGPSVGHGTLRLVFTVRGEGAGRNDATFDGVHAATWIGFQSARIGESPAYVNPDTTNRRADVELRSAPIPFVAGVPVAVYANLAANLRVGCQAAPGLGGQVPCVTWSATVVSQSTAVLSAIEVFDAAGLPVTNFSVRSATGTPYQIGAGPRLLTTSVNGSTVTLSWQPPLGATVPLVYSLEAAVADGPYTLSFPVAATSLVVPGVPPGVYRVRVRVAYAGGVSLPSNEVIVTVGFPGER